jgi:hypothetical protein
VVIGCCCSVGIHVCHGGYFLLSNFHTLLLPTSEVVQSRTASRTPYFRHYPSDARRRRSRTNAGTDPGQRTTSTSPPPNALSATNRSSWDAPRAGRHSQCASWIWPVVQRECADRSVETRIGERQRADVPDLEAHALAETCFLHPPGRTLNHFGRDVDAYHF